MYPKPTLKQIMPPECYCPCLLLNLKSKTPFHTSCYSPLVCCLEHCLQVAAQEVQKIYGHRYSDEVVYPAFGSSHMIFSEPTFYLVKSQPHATTCSRSPHMPMALVPHHTDTPVKTNHVVRWTFNVCNFTTAFIHLLYICPSIWLCMLKSILLFIYPVFHSSIWQILWMAALNGKNWLKGMKDSWNMIMCKLSINKHESTCSGIYWNNVGVPG